MATKSFKSPLESLGPKQDEVVKNGTISKSKYQNEYQYQQAEMTQPYKIESLNILKMSS